MFWGLLSTNYMLLLGMGFLFVASSAAALNRHLVYVSLYAFVLLVVVLNPAFWEFYAKYVTGYINLRLMWAVPIPFMFTVLAGMAWQSLPRGWAMCIPVALVLGMIAPGSILHQAAFGLAPIKVPQPAYDLAIEINARTPQNDVILAPEDISAWVATLEEDRPVVDGRWLYIPQRKRMLPPDDHAAREHLFNWTEGKEGADLTMEEAAVFMDHIGVRVVVTRDGTPAHETMQASSLAYGFAPVMEKGGFTVFQRRQP